LKYKGDTPKCSEILAMVESFGVAPLFHMEGAAFDRPIAFETAVGVSPLSAQSEINLW
jgi:hypothetical protein